MVQKTLQPIHKGTVAAELRKGKRFIGWIAPSKVSEFHVRGGWHIGMPVLWDTVDEMENTISNFKAYNCNPELGQRVRLWRVQ